MVKMRCIAVRRCVMQPRPATVSTNNNEALIDIYKRGKGEQQQQKEANYTIATIYMGFLSNRSSLNGGKEQTCKYL